MAIQFEDKAFELGRDVIVKITWDSIMQKRFVLDKENLLDRAISHGIYIFFVKDMLIARFKQNIETELLVNFFASLVGKTALDILVKIIRKREFNYIDLLVSNATSEVLGMI
ncbi:hypothetical protein KY366_06775, partial [Candidatus Woesearchaeota archaeon]|nr:hypothetical protein [Candidatus Woesearchaeota archaeon]